MLVAEKVQRSPLFSTLLQEAMKRAKNHLTLIVFSDEANPGNALHARHPRKTNLVYASFLELPVLFVDSLLWVPLSAVRADDVSTHATSYAEVMCHLLESVREETEHRITVCFDDGAQLFFIERVLLLNDHEGLRSVTGAKGSAGVKCCCHCINVLSLGRDCPPGYYDISEVYSSNFVPQTDDGLAAVQRRLATCQTKKELAQVETLLGWNADSLSKSIFASEALSTWIRMDSLYLDAMHQYQSGGMVGQEDWLLAHAICRLRLLIVVASARDQHRLACCAWLSATDTAGQWEIFQIWPRLQRWRKCVQHDVATSVGILHRSPCWCRANGKCVRISRRFVRCGLLLTTLQNWRGPWYSIDAFATTPHEMLPRSVRRFAHETQSSLCFASPRANAKVATTHWLLRGWTKTSSLQMICWPQNIEIGRLRQERSAAPDWHGTIQSWTKGKMDGPSARCSTWRPRDSPQSWHAQVGIVCNRPRGRMCWICAGHLPAHLSNYFGWSAWLRCFCAVFFLAGATTPLA